MPVIDLLRLKKEIDQRFSTRDLFDLVFTDYKDFPSELKEIQSLEVYAKRKVSQIVNAVGIQQLPSLQDFFAVLNEILAELEREANGQAIIEAAQKYLDSAGGVAAGTGVATDAAGNASD